MNEFRGLSVPPRAAIGVPSDRADGGKHSPGYDLVCLSHLRWDFVYQRPQHLLSRFTRERRVFYVEEPIYGDGPARLDVHMPRPNLWIVVPSLPDGLPPEESLALHRGLLDGLLRGFAIHTYALWFYTPMALAFAAHLRPLVTVYDCMDELSAFAGAPPIMREREADLFARADLVFTGGASLYESKRARHPRVFCFPSSVDVAHFAQARRIVTDPPDQAGIPHPRLGFFGVLDERLDGELLAQVAAARPDWQMILVGPIVKIDPADLPHAPNIHYLGMKSYDELPIYLAGWDVALLPFAINDATRFISPTKTPEYLAAGKPVVSTPIRDVVRTYGAEGLARIAGTPAEFIVAIAAALRENDAARVAKADAYLANNSWDTTWQRMRDLINAAATENMATIAPLTLRERSAAAAD